MKEGLKPKKKTGPTEEELEELREMDFKIKSVVNDQPKFAIELCRNYADLAIKYGSIEHCIEYNYWYGVAYNLIGENQLAINYYLEAIKRTNKKKLTDVFYRTFISLGVCYRQIGNYVEAISCYTTALENKSKIYFDIIYNNMGVIYYNMGELDKAVNCFQNAYEIYKANGELVIALGVLNNIGRILTIQKKFVSSESVLTDAHKIAIDHGLQIEIVTSKFNLATLKFYLNAFEASYILLQESIEILNKYTNKQMEYSILFLLAKVCHKKGKTIESSQFYLRSMRLAKSISKIDFVKCVNEYSMFLNEQKRYKLAYRYLKLVVVYNRRYNVKSISNDLNKQRIFFENKERELKLVKLKQVTIINHELVKKAKLVEVRNRGLQEAVNALTDGQLLRSQMNPNFIYNTLNSISLLLKSNQNIKGQQYLLLFSKLMRDTYNKSSMEKITLLEELSIVDCYLKMELIRYGGSFSYEIKTDMRIDKRYFYVPPMIIQPIVENAFKHGLFRVDSKIRGNIRIDITATRFHGVSPIGIKILISDNGIGIKDYRNFLKSLDQKSAILITQRRLKNFNKSFEKSSDLKIKHVKPMGCSVCLLIKNIKAQ